MTERFPSDGENRLGGMRILTAFLAFMAILVGLLAGAVVALAGGLVPPRQRPLPAGWVHVPVWVGPPPQPAMPVIEAEFVSDPRRG
jgi:xanthine/uracil permease